MGISQQIGASSLIKPGVIDNSTQRPASPYEGQAIYQKDTDEVLYYNGTSWSRPWNMPWGKIAYNEKVTSTPITTTVSDLGPSVTFTAVTGRLYKYTFYAYAVTATTSNYSQSVLADAANNPFGESYVLTVATYYNHAFLTTVRQETAGSVTRKIRASLPSGTGTYFALSTAPMYLLVEDIGPA